MHHIHIHVYTYIHIHAHTCVHIHTHTCTYMCTHMHIHAPPNVYIDYHMHIHAPHACTIKGTYMCTIYTYMHHQTHVHHQIPPKYKIYPVGLPSVLYETPGPNERSVLNQLFWCFSLCFSLFRWKLQCFSWKPPLFMKTAPVFIVSFWVITKYRSFVRKTNYYREIVINSVLDQRFSVGVQLFYV